MNKDSKSFLILFLSFDIQVTLVCKVCTKTTMQKDCFFVSDPRQKVGEPLQALVPEVQSRYVDDNLIESLYGLGFGVHSNDLDE